MNTLEALKKRIKKNEGFKKHFYRDSLGFLTIGYGHLIKVNEGYLLKKNLTKSFLTKLFEKDFDRSCLYYNKNYKHKKYKQNIKEVLIEMIFQLGIKKQKKFIKMNRHLAMNNIYMAALEMRSSLWYKQTPKRVDSLIKILLKK